MYCVYRVTDCIDELAIRTLFLIIFYVLRNKKLPGNLNGNPAISGSGAKRCGPNANG